MIMHIYSIIEKIELNGHFTRLFCLTVVNLLYWHSPQIGLQYEIKDEATIALQCKLNGKIIAALLFIEYSCHISGECQLHNTLFI